MKRVASNEVRRAADAAARSEGGKPRTLGYPVSNRSNEFAHGTEEWPIQPVAEWAKRQGFKTDWEVGLKKVTGRTGV